MELNGRWCCQTPVRSVLQVDLQFSTSLDVRGVDEGTNNSGSDLLGDSRQ